MAITFRAYATSGAGGTPRVVNKPTGTQEGDLLLLHFGIVSGDEAPTVPAGFALVESVTSDVPSTRIYAKVAGDAEPDTYSVTFASGSSRNVGLSAFYPGEGNTLAVDVSGGQHNAAADRTWPSVETTVDNTLLCLFATLGNTGTTPPAGADERYDEGTVRLYLATLAQASAGASGVKTASGIDTDNSCVVVALREVEPDPEAQPIAGAQPEVYRLFLLQPEVVLSAQVNQSLFVYPMSQVTYDSATGDYTDVRVGMTVLFGSSAGADDLGRSRIRLAADATTLYFGRSSRGVRRGEVNLTTDVHITVLDLYEVWARPPFISSSGEVEKDPGLAVEWRTTTPPPVCNIGAGVARTIDPDTSTISVALDATNSYATSSGATITTYLWDIADGTAVSGTINDSTLAATFPAGFRWVSCTVTDSESHTATMRIPVFARDPAADLCVPFEFQSRSIGYDGQRVAVRIVADIPTSTYPTGTLAMLWKGEPADLFDRSHMILPCAWVDDEPAQIEAQRTGTLKDVTLQLVDVGGRLSAISAYSQRVEDDSLRDTTQNPAISWFWFVNLNMDLYLHYLLAWHSSALALADFYWSGTGDTYAVTGLHSDGQSLWDQIASKARALKPDRHFTCDRLGALRVVVDPMLQNAADRTATVQATLDASDWADVRYTATPRPRLYWLRSGAVRTGRTVPISTVFSVAPGDAPGQGELEQTGSEGLAVSQNDLNETEGHRYARINAPESEFRITLSDGDDRGIEPAHLTWVRLTLPAAVAAQRGLSFTEARGLPKELNIRYSHSREGLTKTVELVWERETSGTPAVTEVKEAGDVPGDDVTWPGDYWGEPPPEVPDVPDVPFYDPVGAYLLWDGAHVYRTMDILGSPVVWEFVDTGLSGNIQDCQYVLVDANTVGIWLLASTGIWFCGDILATTPSWSNVLPVATVQAADATPATGSVVCKCMANYASAPGYLCVATGPQATDTDNTTYAHAYFWHTHDYGQNWTQVDMTDFLVTTSGNTRGYCNSDLYAMEIFRSAPGTIYCVRSIPVVGLNRSIRVFLSTDLGDTWSMAAYNPPQPLNNRQDFSILHPFPSASDYSYLRMGPSLGPRLFRSADEWATGTQLTDADTPSGYKALSQLWRVNKISDDPDHVLAWMIDADNEMVLLESNDGGVNWSALYDTALQYVTVPNTPNGNVGGCAMYATPNGWPPDSDMWFTVRAVSSPSGTVAGCILMTTDRFATTPSDRSGNIATLLGGSDQWTHGSNGGIALPKVGTNA